MPGSHSSSPSKRQSYDYEPSGNYYQQITDDELELHCDLLAQYGWKVNFSLGVVDSMAHVMSYVRTGTTSNSNYYANRLREVRGELKKSEPKAARRLKEELCAIAFNCTILVALPLVEQGHVDAFLLERPTGVLPKWLHMPTLTTTVTVASFPSSNHKQSLYVLLEKMPKKSRKETFLAAPLVRCFPGYRAMPSRRRSDLKVDSQLIVALHEAKAKFDSQRQCSSSGEERKQDDVPERVHIELLTL